MSGIKREPPDIDEHGPGGFMFVSCGTELTDSIWDDEETTNITEFEKMESAWRDEHNNVVSNYEQLSNKGLWYKGCRYNSSVPSGNNIISFDSYLERTEVIVVDVTARCKRCGKNVDCECCVTQQEPVLNELMHYTCRTCKKMFVCTSDLKQYPSFYSDFKGYQCDVCSIPKETGPQRHVVASKPVSLERRKNFCCHICDKTFIQLASFVKHNLVHSSAKMYTCNLCNENFNVLNDLIDHKLNHVNSEIHPFDINIKSFCDLPSDEKSAVIFFQKVGILPPKRICQRGHDMKLYFGEKLKTRWYCNIRTCRTKTNMRVGNWFEGSKLPFLTAIRFIYYWTKELTSVEWCRRELDIANSTTVDWNNYLREVCVASVEKQSVQKIGGKNMSVEVNLSMVSRQKCNSQCISLQQWIFGGICHETNDCFLIKVPDRSLKTVMSAVTQHIEDGSIIYSDMWPSYYKSATKDSFEALKRDHNYNFIDYETETHTKTLERLWGSDKWRSKKYRGIALHLLGSYLAEYLWRQQLKDREPFVTILQCIKDFRPPEIVCKPKELSSI